MATRDRAAYMREYRAQKKEDARLLLDQMLPQLFARDDARIAELEEEVRHLKEELAKRPTEEDVRMAVSAERSRLAGIQADWISARARLANGVSDGVDAEAMRLHDHAYSTRPFTPVPKKGK